MTASRRRFTQEFKDELCRWLAVSTSGFYDWVKRPQSAAAARRHVLAGRVRGFFTDSVGTYGYRRIHADLVAESIECSPELVRQIMRQEGLVPCQPRPFRVTTQPDAEAAAGVPDLLERDFTAQRPGVKFVGDISYIHTWQGFIHLATVIDCCSEKVVGGAVADHMRTSLVADALENAAATTWIAPKAIWHSGRGVYTSAAFRALVISLGMQSSMGRTGVCWDQRDGRVVLLGPEERESTGPSTRPRPKPGATSSPTSRGSTTVGAGIRRSTTSAPMTSTTVANSLHWRRKRNHQLRCLKSPQQPKHQPSR